MNDKLVKILKKLFDVEMVTDETSIVNVMNWDSLKHVELITALEKSFNVKIDPVEAIEMTNVKIIKEIIHSKKPD
ncbi:MAG: acyl carrier protein [Acidobacteria bacterium]|jgi:acyl carrier protein|nr:acyl carrier protein [Acidobacteriota bacterium]|tara:strand:+ start:3351 stop:3575 length:225 start_codon:yes stop_codon:yes gene_type:complete